MTNDQNPITADDLRSAMAQLRDQQQEINRLRTDNRLLAQAVMGWTPDRNTQTEQEASAIDGAIEAAANRALSGATP